MILKGKFNAVRCGYGDFETPYKEVLVKRGTLLYSSHKEQWIRVKKSIMCQTVFSSTLAIRHPKTGRYRKSDFIRVWFDGNIMYLEYKKNRFK